MPSAIGGNVWGMSIVNVSTKSLPANSFVAKTYANGIPNISASTVVTIEDSMLRKSAVSIRESEIAFSTKSIEPRAAK
jgi:hypothetical protein